MGVTTPAATQSTSVWLFICDLQDADGPGGGGGGGCGGRGPGGCCCDSRRSLLVLSRRDADKGGGDEAVETLLRVACISTVLLNSSNERCENLLPEALRSSSVHEMCGRGKAWKRSIATVCVPRPIEARAPHHACMLPNQHACSHQNVLPGSMLMRYTCAMLARKLARALSCISSIMRQNHHRHHQLSVSHGITNQSTRRQAPDRHYGIPVPVTAA